MTGPAPHIDADLVHRLVAEQFPQWSDLPVRSVQAGGWDNRTFHLGDRLSVRLPSAAGYQQQVDMEHRWLPVLAPQLPLPVPVPVAKGRPGAGYPFSWSIYRWIDGEQATADRIGDLTEFAVDLAGFLTALQRVDPTGGPAAGAHSFYRGASLRTYDDETRGAIAALGPLIPADTATEIWQTALDATWEGPPVWFHGDIAHGNLLVRDGRLAAVIDFGTSGVGDPSCDVAIAWTLFSGASRDTYREELAIDSAAWARGRGWTLWKQLITLAEYRDKDPLKAAAAHLVLNEIFAEYAEPATAGRQ